MLVEGGKKYEVKLVNQNGSREEAVFEIVSSLDNLVAISDQIFTTIKTRMEGQRSQLKSLGERISIASSQIRALKGSHKALRLMSPAKYPAEGLDSLYGRPLVAGKVEGPRPGVIPSSFLPSIKHHDDLLTCFHVRQSDLLTGGRAGGPEAGGLRGLGTPPQRLVNMDSFLLFNTAENPYQNYRVSTRDPLQPRRRVEEIRELSPRVSSPKPSEPPPVVVETDDFYYCPSTLQIPEIDVPEFLPHLPGVVESMDICDIHPTQFPPFYRSTPTDVLPSTLQETYQPFLSPIPPKMEASESMKREEEVHGPEPGPPPPPPPPPIQPAIIVNPVPVKPLVSGEVPERSNLMAAIRAAGGLGSLNSAKERKYEAKKKKQEEKSSLSSVTRTDGGDLMSDLKNSLAMRRKGISGIQQGRQPAAGVGDIMQKLVTSIPNLEQDMDESEDSENEDWID